MEAIPTDIFFLVARILIPLQAGFLLLLLLLLPLLLVYPWSLPLVLRVSLVLLVPSCLHRLIRCDWRRCQWAFPCFLGRKPPERLLLRGSTTGTTRRMMRSAPYRTSTLLSGARTARLFSDMDGPLHPAAQAF